VGFTLDYRAIATLTDGSTQDVTDSAAWSSSDTAIATVTKANGLATVEGVAAGTATVTASVMGTSAAVTGSVDVTVTAATLTSIVVTPSSTIIAKGSTQQYTARGTFSDGTNQDITRLVTWAVTQPTCTTPTSSRILAACLSAPTGYVTISNVAGTQGRATGVQVTVDQTDTDVVHYASITASRTGVTSAAVQLGVSSDQIKTIAITIVDDADHTVSQIPVGESVHIKATCTYEDNRVDDECEEILSFTSNNEASVSVDSAANTATGVAPGGAAITAVRPANAPSATINSVVLTVQECAFTTIALNLPTELPLGGTSSATATLSGGACSSITLATGVAWTSNNPSVTITAGGLMTASATPTPPVTSWGDVGGSPGLNVQITAVYTNSAGGELSQGSTLTLRNACVASLTAAPALSATMPLPSGGETQLSQDITVTGTYSIASLGTVDLTAATAGIAHSIVDGTSGGTIDAFTGSQVTTSTGVLTTVSSGNAGDVHRQC
jgi:hypothetical protein